MNTDNKLISIFGSVEDPRNHVNQLHDLVDCGPIKQKQNYFRIV